MKKQITLSIIAVLTVLSVVLASPLQLFGITANAQTEYTEGDYTYTVTDGEATITAFDKSISGDVVIPPTLGGYPVTAIDDWAFSYCKALTAVIIPDSVKSMGYSAFFNCSSLVSVTIPDSVISINSSAFEVCTALKAVYITDISAWCNIDFKNFSNPLYYAKNLYLNGKLVTDLIIPDGVASIGSQAFNNCTSITSVTIPDSVKSIGSSAFYNCKALKSVYITDVAAWCNTEFVSTTANPLYYAKKLYLNGDILTNLEIPDGVTNISTFAFYNCEAITSVTIPDSIKGAGDSAFYNCKSLNGVYITDIAAWCGIDFADYTSNPLSYAANLYLNAKLVTDLEIPDGVTSIGNYAFYNCDSIIAATVSDSVKDIGAHAFVSCSSLKSITLSKSLTSIGNAAFNNCRLLSSVEIPEGVTKIGNDAFRYCESLKTITLPETLTSIGSGAFDYCCLLLSVEIPANVTKIENDVFGHCESLKTITIPEGITEIGDRAFEECKSLKAVTIPESVKWIGYNAFILCTSLERVDIADFEAWNEIAFGTSYSNPMCYAGNLYINGQLLTELRLPRVQTISMYQYCGCKCIENVFLPETVTVVDIGAFYDCTGIKNVYFEGSVEQWKNIRIYAGNEKFTSAEIYFNYGKEIDASPTAENLVSATQTLLNGYNDLLIDYSGDGKINILDLVILKKKIAEDTN
ncbi:MAG: leucine-rich repeat domain-containing protein [Clostridia bacterium]|nr:leucine-rich repeat domain-containing protein [Clostridia bacterium]